MNKQQFQQAIDEGFSHMKLSDKKQQEVMLLAKGEKVMKQKISFGLVLALVLVMVAVVAMAAVALLHPKGVLSALDHVKNRDNAEIEMITTDVVQSGGHLVNANFTARDAFYDGRIVRVAIAHTPTADDATAIWSTILDALESFGSDDDIMSKIQEAQIYGENIVATDVWLNRIADENDAALDGIDQYWSTRLRDGQSEVDVFGFVLPPEISPKSIRLEFGLSVGLPKDDGTFNFTVESGALSVEIPRTINPDVFMLSGNTTYDEILIKQITLQYTPYEMGLFIDFEPLTDDFTGRDFVHFFTEDLQPLLLESGSCNNDTMGGIYSYSIIEATDQLPTILYTQYDWADEAIKINFEDSTIEVVPAIQ